MRSLLIILLLSGLFLYLTNPSMDEFSEFVEDEAEKILMEQTGDGRIGRILSDFGSGLAGSIARNVTSRSDYYFFSLYRMELEGVGDREEQWRFVGIAGTFLETQRPRSVPRSD